MLFNIMIKKHKQSSKIKYAKVRNKVCGKKSVRTYINSQINKCKNDKELLIEINYPSSISQHLQHF